MEVVNVPVEKPHPCSQGQAEARYMTWRDHSTVGLPDEVRAQELASKIRTESRFASGLGAAASELLRRPEEGCRRALPKSSSLSCWNPESIGISVPRNARIATADQGAIGSEEVGHGQLVVKEDVGTKQQVELMA